VSVRKEREGGEARSGKFGSLRYCDVPERSLVADYWRLNDIKAIVKKPVPDVEEAARCEEPRLAVAELCGEEAGPAGNEGHGEGRQSDVAKARGGKGDCGGSHQIRNGLKVLR